MARRMQFSVVGLPHYTIWHLYEPSADDLRHMEEMENERVEREKKDREQAERQAIIDAQFDMSKNKEWEEEKAMIQKEKIAGEAVVTKKEEEGGTREGQRKYEEARDKAEEKARKGVQEAR